MDADPGLPGDVRPAGPLRLRRRRRLQRAGRLHRPLPDRARRRRRGGRRPDLRHRRHLEPPLERADPAVRDRSRGRRRDRRRQHRRGRRRPTRAAHVQIPNNPTGVWVNDYTIQPENGGLGVFAHEFAPRPRPAGPLRHLRQHRWRGEQRRLLVADEPVARHRAGRPGHRRPGRCRSARGRSSSSAGSTTTSSAPAARPRRAAPGPGRPAAASPTGWSCPARQGGPARARRAVRRVW